MAQGGTLLQFPLGGLHRGIGVQRSAPFYTADALNVRPRDSIERRLRGGSRPGTDKAYSDLLFSGNPIRMLASVRPQTTPAGGYISEQFNANPTVATLWSPWTEAGWFTINGQKTIGQQNTYLGMSSVYAVGNNPSNAEGDQTLWHRLKPADMDTTGVWTIALGIYPPAGWTSSKVWPGRFRLYAGFDNSAPGAADSIIVLDMYFSGTIAGANQQMNFRLSRYSTAFVEEASPAPASGTLAWNKADGFSLKLRLTPSNATEGTARAYVNNTAVTASIAYSGASAITGQAFGFGTVAKDVSSFSAGQLQTIEYFTLDYKPVSSELRTRRLFAIGNASAAYEGADGVFAAPTMTGITFANRQLTWAERTGKIYVADYDPTPLASDSGATTNSSPGLTFTDGSVNFTNLGVTTTNHVLEVVSGTGVTPGFYPITNVGTTTLTLGYTPGESGSAIVWKVWRVPKVFDYDTQTITKFFNTTDATGQPPIGCPIVCRFMDCLVWGGRPDEPHNVFFSRQGTPTDYNYGADGGDLQRAIALSATDSGVIAEQLNALIPIGEDMLLFGYESALWLLRGHPAQGGRSANISTKIGIIGRLAWCHGPNQEVYFLSRKGVCRYQLGGAVELLSEQPLPNEIRQINNTTNILTMQYDVDWNGLHIYITPEGSSEATHYWFDLDGNGWWPMRLPITQHPLAIISHDVPGFDARIVILGCRDGYLRRMDSISGQDDGTAFSSYIFYGPLTLGSMGQEGVLATLDATLAEGSGDVNWGVRVGETAKEAFAESNQADGIWSAGLNYTDDPRCGGGFAYVRIEGDGEAWAIEELRASVEASGRLRKL